jgi:hypothetical protein
MTGERDPKVQGIHAEVGETQSSRPLTHGEFYLAMSERPDKSGLGLHPDFRSFFVGQERAYRQLFDALTQFPSGTLVVISAPSGAGKNALVDVVSNDLVSQGKLGEHDAQWVDVDFDLEEGQSLEDTNRNFYVDKPDNWKEIKPKALCVDEVAYAWWRFNNKESLQKQLAIAGKFLGKEVPIMVLLGDHALEDPEIVGAVGSPYEPIVIKLDPLTQDMLKETLRQRLAYALERAPEEIDVDSMLDPEFLTALLPNTEHPISTMRTSLAVLESIGIGLKPTEEPLRISRELARRFYEGDKLYKDFWRASEQKQQFLSWIIQHINNHGNGRDVMKAMSVEDMMQACPLNIEPDRYQRRIIDEMSQTNIGIKRVSSSPDLYLPSEELFLLTALRQMPLDPESELGKAEVTRMEHEVDKKAGIARSGEGLSYWKTFIRKMSSLYGWSDGFGRGLVLDALSTLEERKKAEQEDVKKKVQETERGMRGG